jgi:hypothetical protein
MFKPFDAWGGDFASKLKKAENERAELESARKAAAERRATLSLSDSPNLIDAFNLAYTLAEILASAGYDQDGDKFRHPHSESGSYSAAVRVDEHGVERVHTLSTSDPLYVKGSRSGHDTFSAFTAIFHNGDINAALRDAGNNWLTVGGVSWNKAKQSEYAKKKTPATKTESGLFQLIPIKKLIDNPVNIRWLINHFIEAGGMNLISAPYATFKTFLTLEMAFCVAAGISWYGNKVTQCPVIIICGEGLPGIADRVAALEVKYGISCPECLYISRVPAQLTDTVNAAWVGEAVNALCPDAGLVVIDTLNRNFGGLDENSTRDMTAFISNTDNTFRATDKTVIIVHHTGHVEKDRGRGNSALPAACEGEFVLKKQPGGVVLTCMKQKNAAKPEAMQFGLKPITLPGRFDEDGAPIVNLVLECNGMALPATVTLKPQDKGILKSLQDAIAKHGIEPPEGIKVKADLPGEHKVVRISHWRELAYEIIKVSSRSKDNGSEAKRKAFERGRDVLLDGNFIDMSGENVWIK